jgi:hypothetical protein
MLALVTSLLVIGGPAAKGMAYRPIVKAQSQVSVFGFNEYLAETARFTLPFHLVDGLILIDGEVEGVPGKFMFDTGTQFPFFLNNHRLPLAKDTFLAQGTTASGQELVLYTQNEAIDWIELADQIRFEQVRSLPHTDWSFVEAALVPDFLGTLGHGFNGNYLFVIDYDAQTIDFYSLEQTESVLATSLDPDRILATLNFVPTDEKGNMPGVELTIGDRAIAGVFDTGDHGTLELTAATQKALVEAGYLTVEPADYLYGTYEPYTRCRLTGLQYGDQTLADLHNLRLITGEENRLMLGYQFLKNYVTAWNYQNQTITLLKR